MRTGILKAAIRFAATVALAASLAPISAATFGTVVPIGGNAADLALDESRGVLYIANFTGNRIEVMSLADLTIRTSMNVAAQPSSIALSPDGRYLVVTHFGNYAPPAASSNALTIIDLNTRNRQTMSLASAPLGVAFGIDGLALLVTTSDFQLLDPATGTSRVLDTVAGLSAKTLPSPAVNFPANIVASSVSASGDGLRIYGITAASTTDTQVLQFRYDVQTKGIAAIGIVSTPPLGPRAISVAKDGSSYLAGWALNDPSGTLMAQFADPAGILNVGSHAIDQDRGVIYAQFTSNAKTTSSGTSGSGTTTTNVPTSQSPVFNVLDIDNLAVLERYNLAENLAGKSIISSDNNTMYSVSDSGVTVFPIGALRSSRRVMASVEDVVFRGNFCDRRVAAQQITIADLGGNSTDFTIVSDNAAVTVSPISGVTPATVTISVDPSAFQNNRGTVAAKLTISTKAGINIPSSVRVLVNNKEPDQRGTFINVPGKLVDILPDPTRDRFFVLRQDANRVLVFDGTSYQQVASLKTGNTPTQMAITFDRRYLLIGSDNSQILYVYDLETLQQMPFVRMPYGHYPRSVAASGKSILVANRVAGTPHVIDKVDLAARTATTLPSLGVFKNDVNIDTVLVGSPNGASIMGLSADGSAWLYDANVDSFTVSRKDFTAFSGAYAASSFGQFFAGNTLLNSSLVPVRVLESASGKSSGFSFVDQNGYRVTAADSTSYGVLQGVNLASGVGIRPTRTVEAPVLPDAVGTGVTVFSRTLAPLYSRNNIVMLTTSGFTVLPWTYDASVASPQIDRIVNAADSTSAVAPGGLITIFGSNLSPTNLASREMPLPTALGDSCLTVNGMPVPVMFVSPSQINAQLPFQAVGNVSLILRTPGGVSDTFNFTARSTAPSIFRTGSAGTDGDLPLVYRVKNEQLVTISNPIRRDDEILIVLTGMGTTTPAIDAGLPAPSQPLAQVLTLPTVDINGYELPVTFAGLTPGQVGVYQINAVVPGGVPQGFSQKLRIKQGGYSTEVVVRVVN